jgi:hypothetical protein
MIGLVETLHNLHEDPDLAAQETNPITDLLARVQELLDASSSAGSDFQEAVQRGSSRRCWYDCSADVQRSPPTSRPARLQQSMTGTQRRTALPSWRKSCPLKRNNMPSMNA